MYISDIKEYIITIFKNTTLKEINDITKTYNVVFEYNDFLKFNRVELGSISKITTISILCNLCEIAYKGEIQTLLESITIKELIDKFPGQISISENRKEIINTLEDYIFDKISDFSKVVYNILLFEYYKQLNPTNEISFNTDWISEPKDFIEFKEHKFYLNKEFFSIQTKQLIYDERGYFSIIYNCGDDGDFYTIFETDI